MRMVGFRAVRITDSVAQVNESNKYTKLLFDQVIYDTSGRYDVDLSRWTPVLEGEDAAIVKIGGQSWIVGGGSGGGNNPQFVVKVIKNGAPIGDGAYGGTDLFTGIGVPNYGMLGSVPIPFSGEDLAQPNDYYELILFATAAVAGTVLPFPSIVPGSVTLDTNPYHQFWYGSCLRND